MFCFTSKLTQHFATLIYKRKLVGVAFVFLWYCGCGDFQDFSFRRWQISCESVHCSMQLIQTGKKCHFVWHQYFMLYKNIYI